jgi:hypothetical protein
MPPNRKREVINADRVPRTDNFGDDKLAIERRFTYSIRAREVTSGPKSHHIVPTVQVGSVERTEKVPDTHVFNQVHQL